MTGAEAAQYLVDAMRTDKDLRFVVASVAGRAGATDVYAWAEKNKRKAIALAQSWQGAVEQDIPPADWVAQP